MTTVEKVMMTAVMVVIIMRSMAKKISAIEEPPPWIECQGGYVPVDVFIK